MESATFTPLIIIGAEILFYILLLVFAIHLLIVSYHWFSYGTSRTAGLMALGIYLGGSALCFLIMLISMTAF